MTLGEPFGALVQGDYTPWMRFDSLSFWFKSNQLTNDSSNVFSAIKFLGVIRFAETYPIIGLLLFSLQKLIPSFAAKRATHLEYTKKMIDARLARETDRSDFMTQASNLEREVSLRLTTVFRSSAIMTTGVCPTRNYSVLAESFWSLAPKQQRPCFLEQSFTCCKIPAAWINWSTKSEKHSQTQKILQCDPSHRPANYHTWKQFYRNLSAVIHQFHLLYHESQDLGVLL